MTSKDIKQIELFSKLSDDAIEELIRSAPSNRRSYKRGDIIAIQGTRVNSLLILLEGAVRAEMNSTEGKRLVVDELEAPSILASAFIYSSENVMPVTIEAKNDCQIWSIDKEYFLGFMARNISVMRSFLRVVSDRSRFLSQKLKALSLQSLRERLLSYLKTYKRMGRQEDIALLLGVARPSLARLLSELMEEGVIIKDREGYRLKDSSQ